MKSEIRTRNILSDYPLDITDERVARKKFFECFIIYCSYERGTIRGRRIRENKDRYAIIYGGTQYEKRLSMM